MECLHEENDFEAINTSLSNTLLDVDPQIGFDNISDTAIETNDNLFLSPLSVKHEDAGESETRYYLKNEKKGNITYNFQKRIGTSGLNGQLYETKLLSLILYRVLHNDNIKEFLLGSNIEGVGAFDDIVLRYESNDTQKSKIIFIQVKHRDDPNKDKVKVEDLLKQDGDFSLQKYLESYLKIKQKFASDKNNAMFTGTMKDIKCEFILYTSAKENFTKKQTPELVYEEILLKTSKNGKIFHFAYGYQDIEALVSTITKSRATLLAKTFSKFILKDNFNNIMAHELIKIYHVYLAHNIINIEFTNIATKDSNCLGKFRESFWTNDDKIISLMRRTILKEITETKGITSTHEQDEIQSLLKSLTFKLPHNFGNHYFHINGSEKKRQKRLEYLYSLFYKLLQKYPIQDSNYITIKLDDDSIGHDKIVQSKDLETYRLAGLVGNLLINDGESDMLKFNLDEASLSIDNIRILQRLKETHDLSLFRFDIDIYSFPKLTINCKKHDRKLVEAFLKDLTFYTDQAKEDEVENVLKIEIEANLNIKQKEIGSLCHVACDAIYLKLHDKIQKWCQNPNSYLNKSCRFYQQAEKAIMQSPLLNIINFIYCEQLKHIEFETDAIDALRLDCFFKSYDKILMIVSDEPEFSSIKVAQYFIKMNIQNDYIFIDLDFVIIQNCLETLQLEVEFSAASGLVIIIRQCTKANNIDKKIMTIMKLFRGKIVIVTHSRFKDILKIEYSAKNVHIDNEIKFSCLSKNVREFICRERKVVFQGVEVNVGTLFDNTTLNILSPNILRKIIFNKELIIGKTLFNTLYNETFNFYINRHLCRHLTINVLFRNKTTRQDAATQFYLRKGKDDIILITESAETFKEICKKNKEKNVHWFVRRKDKNSYSGGDLNVWKQSYGTLQAIIKGTLVRHSDQDYAFKVKHLKDVEDKLVIINAEPGMGKSTLLTHIAVNTKRLHPNLWILQINLLDNISQFDEWRKYKTNINLVVVLKFLYSILDKKYNTYFANTAKVSELVSVNNINEIHFNDHDQVHCSEVDLSEIKLFNYFYNNNNCAVLFDGYDEICPDYADEVIQLFRILKNSKVAHLWITSRQYNVLEQLELALDTFSYNICSLNKLEQKLFLQNIWNHKLGLGKNLTTTCSIYVDSFHTVIVTFFKDIAGTFLSSPLHLYIIAELYQHLFEKYLNSGACVLPHEIRKEIKNGNLNLLYEKFTNDKFFKIRFGNKKPSMNFKDPDIRKILEAEHNMFIENHKKIAVYQTLKHTILSNDEINDVHKFMESISLGEEKTGIIEQTFGGCITQFVHFTFAEYFAVELLFDKLNSSKCTSAVWKYLLDDILISDEKQGIRRFIDSKLQRDQNPRANLAPKRKHMKIVFGVLLAQDNSRGTAIHRAIQEDLDYIVLFLLQTIKPLLNKNNINLFIRCIKTDIFCPFCFAIIKQKSPIVKYIIEIFTDISCRLNVLFYNHHFVTFEHVLKDDASPEMFHILVNAWSEHDPDLMVDLFTMSDGDDLNENNLTQAHELVSREVTFARCWDYFLKLSKDQLTKIFTATDKDGQLPVHYAAKQGNLKFFNAMDNLLGREEFVKICTTSDVYGFTPISRFFYNDVQQRPNDCELKNILKKVYKADIDVEDFFNNKLAKMHL